MEYRIAIFEDDKAEIHETEQMLFAYRELHPENKFEISCHTEVKTFMEAMCTGADTAQWVYDILLMDVYLPDGNGIKCGRKLRDKGFAGVIIYKSSTAENCLDAFAVDAMKYLVKPVSEDELFETMDLAVEKIMDEPESNCDNFDDSDVPIQTKEEKRRKSIKEFLTKWFHDDSY